MNDASRAELKRLLALSVDDRFTAIAQPDLCLTDDHRRELVRSLQKKSTAGSAVSAKMASRWGIWRARLPYRVASVSATVIGIFVIGAFYVVARKQTPEQWVVSAYPQTIKAEWRFKDGGYAGDLLEPRRHYPLVRREGDQGVLRMWTSPSGYAETRVPVEWLRTPR